MTRHVNIPKQPLIDVNNETIRPNTSNKTFRRYITKRYDGEFFEITKKTYDRVKGNPFFEVLIINWYIRGTKDFVRAQNEKELDRAEKRLQGIKRIIVNPLQFYINDTGQ